MIAYLPIATTPPPTTPPGDAATTSVDLFWLALVPMLAGLVLIAAGAANSYLAGQAKASLAEAVHVDAQARLADAEARRLEQLNIQSGRDSEAPLVDTNSDDGTPPKPELSPDAISALERAFKREPQLVIGLLLLIAPLVIVSGYGVTVG